MNTITQRLQELRNIYGYSQEGMARIGGMSQVSWSNWERSGVKSLESFRQIAQHFGVSADWILGLTDDPAPQRIEKRNEGNVHIMGNANASSSHQSAMRQISAILAELETNASNAAWDQLMNVATAYVSRLLGETASVEFYKSVDHLRRTGEDTALNEWFLRYFGEYKSNSLE